MPSSFMTDTVRDTPARSTATDTAAASYPSQPYCIHKSRKAARTDEASTGQPVSTRLEEELQRVPDISQAENGL